MEHHGKQIRAIHPGDLVLSQPSLANTLALNQSAHRPSTLWRCGLKRRMACGQWL